MGPNKLFVIISNVPKSRGGKNELAVYIPTCDGLPYPCAHIYICNASSTTASALASLDYRMEQVLGFRIECTSYSIFLRVSVTINYDICDDFDYNYCRNLYGKMMINLKTHTSNTKDHVQRVRVIRG